ncbi:MAG: LysM peptidoglycan-binding domain-containing protein [Actinobacteria bacterium]|nr:LysM peptidoglycan-binding domain-containing protein [Actinomycetota bacterium]
MFGRLLLVVALSLFLWASFARSSDASAPDQRYVVQPADTLWSIAATRYGDPREGVYELRERNRLAGTTIVPGQVLILPG